MCACALRIKHMRTCTHAHIHTRTGTRKSTRTNICKRVRAHALDTHTQVHACKHAQVQAHMQIHKLLPCPYVQTQHQSNRRCSAESARVCRIQHRTPLDIALDLFKTQRKTNVNFIILQLGAKVYFHCIKKINPQKTKSMLYLCM